MELDESQLSEKLGVSRAQLRIHREESLIRAEDFKIAKKRVVYTDSGIQKTAVNFGLQPALFSPEKPPEAPDTTPPQEKPATGLETLVIARACGNRKFAFAYRPGTTPKTIDECQPVRVPRQFPRGTRIQVEHRNGQFPIFKRTLAS